MKGTAATRISRGLGAIVVLAVLLVAIPVALYAVAGSPVPTSWPSMERVQSTLSNPDLTGTLLLGLLKVAGWVAWATFAVAILWEIPAALRGVRTPRLGGLGLQQRVAASLIAAIIAMVTVPAAAGAVPLSAGLNSAPTSPAVVAGVAVVGLAGAGPEIAGSATGTWTAGTAQVAPAVAMSLAQPSGPGAGLRVVSDQAHPAAQTPQVEEYTVQPGDSLWRLAEQRLGDGARFKEIADLNYGIMQPDGHALDASHWIQPGWTLTVPVAAGGSAVAGSAAGAAMAAGSQAGNLDETADYHRVRPGETLSSIARDELGNGNRYPEIFQASLDIVQPDGRHLQDADLIHPGWLIDVGDTSLPDAAAPGTSTSVVPEVVPDFSPGGASVPGTTADPETSSGPEAATAPDATATPDSATGPDHAPSRSSTRSGTAPIRPEAAQPALPLPSGGQTSGSEGPSSSTSNPSTSAPSPSSAQSSAPSSERGSVASGISQVGSHLATLAEEGLNRLTNWHVASGVGGFLASGALALLAVRRTSARRERRNGERIWMPAAGSGAAQLESQWRAIADPGGRDTMNVVLRSLAQGFRSTGQALPPLQAARLAHDGVDLVFEVPCELPAPWKSNTDRHLWHLPAADIHDCDVTAIEAPYPTLVTLGRDSEGAYIMIVLEQLGCLDIRGHHDAGKATLAALAVELATSLWADDLQVTVVGAFGELPGVVDTSRIRHVNDLGAIIRELSARAADVERTLRLVGAATVAEARGRGVATDAWTPEILLIAEDIEPAARDTLDALTKAVPGMGVAAVTNEAMFAKWSLNLDPRDPAAAVLTPAGMTLHPQRLDAAAYVQAITLLRATDAQAGPSWSRNMGKHDYNPPLPQPSGIATVIPISAGIAGGAGIAAGGAQHAAPAGPVAVPDVDLTVRGLPPGFAEPTHLQVSVERASTTTETDATAATVSIPLVDAAQQSDISVTGFAEPAGAAGAAELAGVTEPDGPVVRVLGPVEVEVTSGIAMQSSHLRQATELVAYLAFHPGASGADLSASLWPNREPNLATRRSAVSRARRWLGADADGNEHLPRYWSGDGSSADQELATYRLKGVTTDWDAFVALIGDDVTTAPLDRLAAALGLVRDRPFAGIPPRKYVWAEPLIQDFTAAIIDVAHELARRALAQGDPVTARHAAVVGRRVDPADERPWRDAMRAEWAAGKPDAVIRLIEQLRDYLESLELDAEPETEELIAELEDRLAVHQGRRGA